MDNRFDHTSIPIAIIGMACRLPGADNLDGFWKLVSSGGCAVAELPHERLDQELYYHPKRGMRGKSYSKLGAIVSSRQFDRQACPISPELERGVDNAHLLMCQAACEALRHAQLDPFNLPLRNTGVYIGHAQGSNLAGDVIYHTCVNEAAQFLREVPGFQQLNPAEQDAIINELVQAVRAEVPGLAADSPDVTINMISGTISKAFRLSGPFLGINSACASSLHSVLLAARALQLGRVDMAIAGGASDCKGDSLVLFSNAQSMSETGTRPFDADADGLICGEGYVALVLKTLPRALADGDPIQAIILGLGVSSDGRGKSLWAPRKEGQVKAMERAYRHGLDMSTLQYIEAHATSTNLGDATELNALGEILGAKFPPGKKVPITSVKANIGHALEAAGVSSLIKTVLCLQHRTFVPAVNVRELNSKIDWANAPFYIPREVTPWPAQPDGLPRRAAVNAFGIGGLNMHVVLEEFTEDRRAALQAQYAAHQPAAPDPQRDSVAIVGMGCILPDAPQPTRFWELVASGRDPKRSTPEGRWRTDLGYQPGTVTPYTTPTLLGGYVTDFAYDWRAHKLPPKQVEQADPLQFMLLEAADQALQDSGYDQKPFDRTRVGVLVGSEFGSDFGTQLEFGLRLPHMEVILHKSFARRGMDPAAAAKITTDFATVLLKHWPALVDESGSFSTSTLASRITKTMNLMGGAAAIDAGDTSSAAVLSTSVDQLLSGDCDMMICAGGQRRMNLPQYIGVALAGALSTSPNPRAPFDAAADGTVPGEGVAVVILKRLADAQRDGDKIHAIIRGIGAAHADNPAEGMSLAIQRAMAIAAVNPGDVAVIEMDGTGLPARDQEQLRGVVAEYGRSPRKEPMLLGTATAQIGHTAGASAMVSLLKATFEVETGQMPATFALESPLPILAENANVIAPAPRPLAIRHTTHDGRRLAAVCSTGKGQAYHILLERGQRVPVTAAAPAPAAQRPVAAPAVAASAPAPSATAVRVAAPAASTADCRIVRVGGSSASEVAAKLEQVVADCARAFASADTVQFTPADHARLAIVATSPEALAKKAQLAAKQFSNPDARTVLEQQGCFYRQVGLRKPRIAFVFPGQGSHYAGMLRELVRDVPAAATAMRRLDDVLRERGYQTFAQMAWERPEQLGNDVWLTQVVMLLADTIVFAALDSMGVVPDLVLGHSYGEFAALTVTEAWDLPGAITAARARYDAIEATPTARGTLLATTAPPPVIEQAAAALAERTYLANYNAPDQTVVGGSPAALGQLSERLAALGHKSQMLAVPCPYHTPLMDGAGAILARTLESLRMRPPRVPLLSTVTNRYVSDPQDIRANLAAQLTTPVRWVDAINRIADEQDTVFVEVGPHQALTRLNRRILGDRPNAGVIASDNAKNPGIEQLLQVQALLECLDRAGKSAAQVPAHVSAPALAPVPVAAAAPAVAVAPSRSSQPAMNKPAKGTISHVDATQRRIEKMRQMAGGAPKTANGQHSAPAAAPANGANGANGDQRHGGPTNGEHAHAAPAPPVARNGGMPTRAPAPAGVAAAASAPAPPMRPAPAPTPAQPSAPAPAAAPVASAPVAAAPPAQPAPATGGSLNAAELEKFLVNFVVEQTGYPPEVVELDADLEADLGIDSIKKAQLFGELAEYFDVQPTETMSLDDFPTLRHVVNFLAGAKMKGDLPGGVAIAPAPVATPAPAPAPAAAAPAAPATGGSLDAAELEKFLVNFVVEQTGYPPEVVELDADLEADLGIDSIKKAQLFGELAEYFDVQPTETMSLDDFPTLRHVVNFLAGAKMKGDLPGGVAIAPAPIATPAPAPAAIAAPAAPPAPAPGGTLDAAELEKFLVNFVVEQTGYPPEVVELDADLEADLGIDSIKKAQLFGELAEYFDVQPTETMSLDDFPTLRHVVNFLAGAKMKGDLPGGVAIASAPIPAAAPAPEQVAVAALAPAAAQPAAPATSGGSLDAAELEKFLVNFVVEQTGYPPEVVELDADLEADLGIDSIKKAQLFGELAEYFDVQPTETMSLDDFPTLRHVVNFLAGSALKKNLTASPSDAAETDWAADTGPAEPVTVESPAPAIDQGTHGASVQVATLAAPAASSAPAVASARQSARTPHSAGPRFQAGFARGQRQRAAILHRLHVFADRAGFADEQVAAPTAADISSLTADERDELHGVAAGVQVSPAAVLAHGREFLLDCAGGAAPMAPDTPAPKFAPQTTAPPVAAPELAVETGPACDLAADDYAHDDTHRFYLREVPAPYKTEPAAMPAWAGAALIVGEGPLAEALERQLGAAGVAVRQLPISDDLDQTVAAFDAIWSEQPTPHLFIVTGREPTVDPRDAAAWKRRWHRVALVPFFVCQRWVQRVGEANLLDRASVVAVTSLNGTFGFSGQITAPECGALTGLMKSIYIEVVHMRNHRSMRAKAIDAPPDEPPAALAADICRELASGEIDYEVAFAGGRRFVQGGYPQPAPTRRHAPVRPGGAWVITGGARGITAECALELGRRFGLKLHLIGTSPLRPIDHAWRELTPEALKQLKADVMRAARAAGKPMDQEWSRVQRDIEIDRSLRTFADAGLNVTYHACDVADATALAAVLADVRRTSGPIEGILHGAGIERAAGYERKQRDSVLATLGAKFDGALNLMLLTEQDPVRWFIGFGSISGRLGSNGQTDYSLASDALCKLSAWYRTRRPEVHSVGFHWHAWSDVGMAARPESTTSMRIANGPSLMPKREGVAHLLREVYAGAPEGEVLITSWEYHGRFYGTDHHPKFAGAADEMDGIAANKSVAVEPSTEPWPPLPFEPIVARHELQMVAAPLPPGSSGELAWKGPAMILGDNPTAQALAARLQAAGVRVQLLPITASPEETKAAVEALYQNDPPRYLFLMTGRDLWQGSPLDRAAWQQRRALGVVAPFVAAQHWFRLRLKAKDQTPITIVAATSLGGDFGISGQVALADGGALTGMLKSIYVEDTRLPASQTRVKAIDAPADERPEAVVDAIVRELAADDPDVEVGWSRGQRSVVRAVARAAETFVRRMVPRGGNWVITGGARGITAAVAFELGQRYGCKLHLIGRSPAPSADAPWHEAGDERLAQIKAEIVRQAVSEGRSPEKDWERVKYDLEIRATLKKFATAGIEATYYSCDLSDWGRLGATLEQIRGAGPIEGLIHGAGYGKSFRFAAANPESFERTLAGKLDGAVALMSLTRNDRVQYFVGFGSIGGRYGGNGLADYAAANDMFAKLCAWYQAQRPELKVCCLDWQSWDEVGMAMLGDNTAGTKAVLKMRFIPPREGVEHLCRELEAGLPTTEIVITDRHFERTFYPFIQDQSSARPVAQAAGETKGAAPATAAAGSPPAAGFPLVARTARRDDGGSEATIEFHPTADPFLLDHQFRGKPLLPAVIGLECVAEAARLASGCHVVAIRDVELVEGLLFHTERLLEARVRSGPLNDGALACELLTDFRNRADKLIKPDRAHLRATAEVSQQPPVLHERMDEPPANLHAFAFQNNGPLYHGPTLHGVKATTFDARGGWGKLVALSLARLGGARSGRDWLVPATALDAAFYVCGIHAWFHGGQSFSLPAGIERVSFGEMPRDDEDCWLWFACRQIDAKQALYDFVIFGADRRPLLRVEGHRIVMVRP
ncbi:MAG: beta-ketoacyl synthase N-terminal-like domain-containing protein [Pirellulales bacterium]